MTKQELVETVSTKTGIKEFQTKAVIEAALEQMKLEIEAGNVVTLRGFGTFQAKQRAEKKARNITKGTTVIVPAHKVAYFKPSKEFKIK